MASKVEQFSELQRKNMEAAMRLAQLSIENSQRIMAIQSELARELFQDSVANAKAQTSAKDPQSVMSLRAQYAQDVKRVYYLSMEFLIGRSLGDSLHNLGLNEAAREAIAELGHELDEVAKNARCFMKETSGCLRASISWKTFRSSILASNQRSP